MDVSIWSPLESLSEITVVVHPHLFFYDKCYYTHEDNEVNWFDAWETRWRLTLWFKFFTHWHYDYFYWSWFMHVSFVWIIEREGETYIQLSCWKVGSRSKGLLCTIVSACSWKISQTGWCCNYFLVLNPFWGRRFRNNLRKHGWFTWVLL